MVFLCPSVVDGDHIVLVTALAQMITCQAYPLQLGNFLTSQIALFKFLMHQRISRPQQHLVQ